MTSNASNAFTDAPAELRKIISDITELEYASLTKAGTPIGNPVLYYYNDGDASIDLATGLAYPAKANRARNNPQVGLLLGRSVHAYDPAVIGEVGSPEDRTDLENSPVVAIAAMAAVRDSDLQANTDKYVDLYLTEHPKLCPLGWDEGLKDMTHYWIRLWVECTPVRIYWWPDGKLNEKAPEIWEAPAAAVYPTSDPRPPGKASPGAKWPAEPWQDRAPKVLEEFPRPILTSKTEDGFPLPIPTNGAKVTDSGFELDIPVHSPCLRTGSASLSFGVTATFVGELDGNHFKVDRLIGDLPNVFECEDDALNALNERQKEELERRGQAKPVVRRGQYLK